MKLFRYLLLISMTGNAVNAFGQAGLQGASEDPVNWAYAAYFGTGRYQLSDQTETYVLSFSPGWQWRESKLEEDGERVLGFRFRVPVAIGAHDFSLDSIGNGFTSEHISTISAVPGVEIDIPMTDRWQLKSLSYLGFGTELRGGEDATIYWLGMRSQYKFEHNDTEIFLTNGLARVGYSARSGRASGISPLLTGVEFRRQMANRKIGGDPVFLNWHISYTDYLNDLGLELGEPNTDPIKVAGEWEVGIAFSKGDRDLEFWRLRWDRVGLAYRFDTSGDFSGVSLVFRSLFDR